ncbi:MAG: DUF983 domain-containing protein [Saprospiraceae bacterium]|jgi:uncharacterized protein (DUF983 family)|nr:DUF983 domain-containing protein [Saprospiraceae bacterium]
MSKKEQSMLLNTLKHKCPRCQEGDLFIKPFKFSDPVAMPDHCPECGQSYMPEPGFYYGSMFLSYIVTGFFFLGIVGVCIIFLHMSVNQAMGVLLIVAALTYFFFLRMSRSLWINLMVRYDPKSKEQYKMLHKSNH